MNTFTMRRLGRFVANFETTQNQCGKEKARIYNYECEIEVGPNLDQHGFILDNYEVDNYFKRHYSVPQPALSCERIAQIAVNDMVTILQERGREVHRVRVTISGSRIASLSAEWRNSDARPESESATTLFW